MAPAMYRTDVGMVMAVQIIIPALMMTSISAKNIQPANSTAHTHTLEKQTLLESGGTQALSITSISSHDSETGQAEDSYSWYSNYDSINGEQEPNNYIDSTGNCGEHQYFDKSSSCVNCTICHPGTQHEPQELCGNGDGQHQTCSPCPDGRYQEDTGYGPLHCSPCATCHSDEHGQAETLSNCTASQNTQCGPCPKGMVYISKNLCVVCSLGDDNPNCLTTPASTAPTDTQSSSLASSDDRNVTDNSSLTLGDGISVGPHGIMIAVVAGIVSIIVFCVIALTVIRIKKHGCCIPCPQSETKTAPPSSTHVNSSYNPVPQYEANKESLHIAVERQNSVPEIAQTSESIQTRPNNVGHLPSGEDYHQPVVADNAPSSNFSVAQPLTSELWGMVIPNGNGPGQPQDKYPVVNSPGPAAMQNELLVCSPANISLPSTGDSNGGFSGPGELKA